MDSQSQKVTTHMIIMHTSIIQVMTTHIKKMSKYFISANLVFLLASCSISPGMDNPRPSFLEVIIYMLKAMTSIYQ